MTIRNYFEYLGIDGTAILSEETKAEQYICKAFHLKKGYPKETEKASAKIRESQITPPLYTGWVPVLAGCSFIAEERDRE